ncbi:MAG: hypothetical protein FJ104_16715 [Deltaproteobacteria bacterium]|nr:hypothetical protein [Deltaproteobacteria bacterium]
MRLRPFEQLRTLSAVTMVAVSVGGDRVTIAAGAPPTVRVDGAERAVTGQIALPHGGQVLAQGTRVVVEWPSGEGLVVDGAWDALLNASYRRGSSTRNLRGLLGNADGVADNDLSTRDGRLVARANDPGALYADFGESYRVRPTESLFDYAAGETTESLTDRGFPHGPREVLALPVARRRAAHLACAVQGVTDPAAFEACTRDVALTGDLRFARAAAAVGRGR